MQDREAAAQSHVKVKSTELASKSAELVKSSEEDLRLAAEKAALEGELAGLCAQIKADASAGAELGEAVGTIAGVQAHENECAMRPGKDLETLAHEHALDAQTRVHASKTPRHMKKPARCDQRQMLRQVLNWARLSPGCWRVSCLRRSRR